MKTVVITGANRGIGLEFCKQYQEAGCKVVALCRKASPELLSLNVDVIEGIDAGQDGCIALLQQKTKGLSVDILVNNAGIMRQETLDDMNWDTLREQMEVNALGPLRITLALLPLLTEGSKIALITSRMGSISDNTSGARYGYRMSKAALNMAGVSLAHDLKEQKIAVAILHPGYVQTDMTGNKGMIDASESVRGMIQRTEHLNLSTTGTFWHTNGEILPW